VEAPCRLEERPLRAWSGLDERGELRERGTPAGRVAAGRTTGRQAIVDAEDVGVTVRVGERASMAAAGTGPFRVSGTLGKVIAHRGETIAHMHLMKSPSYAPFYPCFGVT